MHHLQTRRLSKKGGARVNRGALRAQAKGGASGRRGPRGGVRDSEVVSESREVRSHWGDVLREGM